MRSRELVEETTWKILGLVILCLRFVQGWIFWGGGSRRFIYDPEKLDPYSTQWMANKLQSAMPGSLLHLEYVISYLLQHILLLYTAIIVFSLAELFSGLGLLFGLFTRFFAFITVLISISLMLIFGWQGTTCMDEWTMAVANYAIGLTLVISGSSIYSLDSWLIHRNPKIKESTGFIIFGSGALSLKKVKKTKFRLFNSYNIIYFNNLQLLPRCYLFSLSQGPRSAQATFTLASTVSDVKLSDASYNLQVFTISRNRFNLILRNS